MTTAEMFEQMKTELDDRVAQLRSAMDEMQASCCHAVHTFREEIERMTKPAPAGGKKLTKPAPAGGEKLYTTLEIIQLVQEIVSEEICGLGDDGMLIAYEVERGIIRKLVKEEDKNETD